MHCLCQITEYQTGAEIALKVMPGKFLGHPLHLF